MTWIDYLILGIIVVSALISLFRGFLRETVSLLAWIIGFWLALRFARDLGSLFGFVHNPSVRVVIGFIILFVLILLIGAAINFFIGKLVKRSGASMADRVLGVIFGLVRGVVIVVVLALIAGFTVLPHGPTWRNSLLAPYAETLALDIRHWLPPDVARDMYPDSDPA
ncbi:MAG TPA: CvpA family protein [Gammaproteobacteria bacterium]|jgi:membrane protein required for colicin V production|nr:CvpA family protein [Gammaproteobacteria bacterium]